MSETQTSGIGGKVRENQERTLFIGLGEVKVICINPNREEYKDLLGMDLKEESKADSYLGESSEGNTTLRVDVWVENVKSSKKDKITFFLENKERVKKDGSKKQYINELGSCSWADDVNNLPIWFTKRDYRIAYHGEEELHTFMRTWLGKLDYSDEKAISLLKWKPLMKGDVKEIRAEIGGKYTTSFGCLYEVKTVEKDGDIKQYQSIYNKAFIPEYSLKQFRLVDYNKKEVVEGLEKKKSKDLKPHERFVLNIKGEYGCKNSYILKDLKEFKEEDFLVASDKVLDAASPEY